MCGGGGIAQQDDVLVTPAFAENAIEIEPSRTAQVARIRHQSVTTEIASEDFLAGRDRFVDVHAIEAERAAMSLQNTRQ